jgi:hypothetical protein
VEVIPVFLSGTVYRSLRGVSLATLVTVLACLPAFAQSTSSGSSLAQPQLHPVAPPTPKDQEQFIVYWTTEPGWNTEILLRNNLEGSNLTVIPAVRTSNGIETALPSVTIAAGDVATVDLRDALTKAAANLGSSWGSLVLRYRSIVNGGLYSSVMVKADGRPIAFHLDGFGRGTTYETGAREGIWWLPRPEVTDWLILTNSGEQAIQPQLVLYDASGKAWQQPLALAAHETQRTSIRDLLQQSGLQGDHGGFKIEVTKGARFLDSAHMLFEQSGGFSAVMKMFRHDPRTTLASRAFTGGAEWTTRAPMLALSNPDSALGVPAGTTLQPKLFVRNTSAKPIAAQLRFDWRSASAAGKSVPISLNLQPNETQLIDVAALQIGKSFPVDANWASVILSAPVLPDDLLAVAASYDQTGRYGAQTPFSDQLASHWEGGRWEVDGTHNSLSTIINGGNKPVLAELTILYNRGQGQYQLLRALAPEEQMFVDFGKLIRDQVPDKDGRTLPRDLMSGAYRVRDLTDSTTASLYEGKVMVDKTFGHVSYGCMVCCGPNIPVMVYDPLTVQVNGSASQQIQAVNSCTSKLTTVTLDFPTWWTDSTSIATASGAKITGVSVGSTNHNALSQQMYWGPKTDSGGGACPLTQEQLFAGTNVTPTITSVSPSRGLIGATTSSVTITGNGLLGGHINTPAAIQVSNITTATNTQITFDAVISSTATPGNNAGAISVTANGEKSNEIDFYVQVPTALSFISGTAGGTTEKLCTSNACGTVVSFKYQVNDQATPTPQPILNTMSIWDSFGAFSPDGLQVGGTTLITTCTFANMTNGGPCGVSTDAKGVLTEGALGSCSTICYTGGVCTTGGPSVVTQTWHIAGAQVAQDVSEYCQKVVVNGVQIQ